MIPDNPIRTPTSRIWILGTATPYLDVALNGLYGLLRDIEAHWTEKQRHVVGLLRKGEQQVDVAKALGVSKQNIHSILKAARYDIYERGWKGLTQLVRE